MVVNGHVMTRVLDMNENEVEIEEQLGELEETDLTKVVLQPCVNYADREVTL
jgi:hypothetical protein